MSSDATMSSRYLDDGFTVDSLADIRAFKQRRTTEQTTQHGTATHHYVDLGGQVDEPEDTGGPITTVAPRADPKPHRPLRTLSQVSSDEDSAREETELAERTVGKQLYVGARTAQALGSPDEFSCVRTGDGARLIVPGNREDWPAYTVTDSKGFLTTKGLDVFGLSRGDRVRFIDRGNKEVFVDVLEFRDEPNHKDVPDDPQAVLEDYTSDLAMDDLIAAAAQYDEPWRIGQRLGGDGPNNTGALSNLLEDLGIRTPSGDVPDDIDERVEAIREVTPDA